MAEDYSLRLGERRIVDHFVENDNNPDWIANIARNLGKDLSGVYRDIKCLVGRVLQEIECPSELIERRERGGAKPRKCYVLDHEMKPEWFKEVARPHLDTDDKSARIAFWQSGFTAQVLSHRNTLDWVVKKRLKMKLEENELIALATAVRSFPSTLRWLLYQDIGGILHKFLKHAGKSKDMGVKKITLFALLNAIIVGDILEEAFVVHGDMTFIQHGSETRLGLLGFDKNGKQQGEIIVRLGLLGGAFTMKYKDVPAVKGMNICPECDSPAQFVDQIGRWYCEKCNKVVAPNLVE